MMEILLIAMAEVQLVLSKLVIPALVEVVRLQVAVLKLVEMEK